LANCGCVYRVRSFRASPIAGSGRPVCAMAAHRSDLDRVCPMRALSAQVSRHMPNAKPPESVADACGREWRRGRRSRIAGRGGESIDALVPYASARAKPRTSSRTRSGIHGAAQSHRWSKGRGGYRNQSGMTVCRVAVSAQHLLARTRRASCSRGGKRQRAERGGAGHKISAPAREALSLRAFA
jgi:hypothetical protein